MVRNFCILALLVAAALAVRCPVLDGRPMHNDEGVNALKIQGLWERGSYAYDPDEYHGPSLFYATLPFVWLSPARDFSQLSEKTLRLAPVFFGAGLVLLLWWLRDGLGAPAMLGAGVLTAISPAMVFYSRYFIHEMLLVFFTMLVAAAGWRYANQRRIGWALLGGAGLGLMHATKETFVLPLGAMGLALISVVLWKRWADRKSINAGVSVGKETIRVQTVRRLTRLIEGKHALAGLLAGVIVSLILFTSFFTHASGPLDSIRSYLPWLHRAGGHSPHIHPFGFYLERLAFFHDGGGPFWSEGLILILAGVGIVAGFIRKGLGEANVWFVRFLALYTIILTLTYSAISYKTPWCMLGFLHGMILLAGVGAVALVWWAKGAVLRAGSVLLLLAAMGHLAWQSWRASYVYEADRRNPYVYAQTVPDLLDLAAQVEAVARVHPDGNRMLIKVMAPEYDYWPLPWYLRRLKRVGWWDRVPEDPIAPVMIVGPKLYASLEKRPDKPWSPLGIYGLRPGTVLQLCVNSELWQRYMAAMQKSPTTEGKSP